MDIGKLNRRVGIMHKVETVDELLQTTHRFEVVHKVWSGIEPVSMKEITDGDKVKYEATNTFVIRYRPDVTEEMKIEYNGKIFDIISVIDPMEKHESLEITAVHRGE